MNKLWTPDDAGKVIPVVRVRHLEAPPPTIGARLQAQHMHWQLGRYKEDLSFGPGGRGRRKRWVVDREGEQHNLVLDQTYDTLMAAHGITNLPMFAVVGTGSTPPSASQVALANEVRRTNRNETGGFWGFSYQRIANGVYEQTVVREFSETEVGNLNLTEWGFSPSGTAGNNLMSRELFRDGNGNPIVITPASDQRLRLIYKTRITLSPTTATAHTINIDGIGPRSGLMVLTLSTGGSGGFYPDLVVVELAMTGNVINSGNDPSVAYRNVYLHSVALPTSYSDTTINTAALGNKWSGVKAYTPGSRQRQTNPVTFLSNEANGTIRTIGLGPSWAGGFRFVLNSGQEITKTNLYRLTIGEFTITWGP